MLGNRRLGILEGEKGMGKSAFWVALGLKVFCGLLLGLLYKYHYQGGDTFAFHHDSKILGELFWERPLDFFSTIWSGGCGQALAEKLWLDNQPRAFFFVRWVAIIGLLLGNNYWLMSVAFSVISFLLIYFAFRQFQKSFPDFSGAFHLAFFFLPSVVFWSAGLMKESLAFGMFLIPLGILSRWGKSDQIGFKEGGIDLLIILFSLWFLLRLKYYFFGMVVIVGFPYALSRFGKGMLIKSMFFLVPLVILGLMAGLAHPNLSLDRFLVALVQNHQTMVSNSNHEDVIVYNLDESWISLLKNLPKALVASLFRPFIWETKNALAVLNALESLGLFGLGVMGAIGCWKNRIKFSFDGLVLLGFIVFAGSLLALSTPNFGTLARYKILYLPFYFVLVTSPFFARSRQ